MKNMKNKIKISVVLAALSLGLVMGGCKDYLDKAPEASISSSDAFKDFISFQGFNEELYNQIVSIGMCTYQADFNFADELGCNSTYFFNTASDAGNSWAWTYSYGCFLRNYAQVNSGSTSSMNKGIWTNSWYGIRVANIGLANFDKLVNATQEEKDIIKGQLLFFRGYFYFELMKYWGGFPYIETLLPPTEKWNLPRLNYRETALKAAADLEAAANLLPVKWDDTEAGKRTLGNNRMRINKVTALSFLGKDLLYAASPLMNRESTGNASFDADLCKKAADAFAQAINICDQTGVYTLQPWEKYTDMFWLADPARKLPGGAEVIMTAPNYGSWSENGSMIYSVQQLSNNGQQFGPTANYVKNWGMANGLPIDDPASGYNPADPWSNRDPRFYKTIVVDNDLIASSTSAGADQRAQLYVGGRHRIGSGANITGFLTNKYWGPTINKYDNIRYNYYFRAPIMRLADVYLMYAESVVQGYGTAQSGVSGCITAEAAFNRVRNRAQLPNLDAKFTGTKDAFMGEIIRERAVELSFEAQRWCDLKRWLLSTQPKYREKYELQFDRGPAPDYKPINIREQLFTTIVFEDRHYWLPMPVDQVTLYPEFKQNPGW